MHVLDFGICRNIGVIIVLLISQLIPVNPFGQLQEYDARPSVHVALFLQGLGVQSSISK